MTTRSRWLDWTPASSSDAPPKPTEGAFVSFDGASVIRSQNSNCQGSHEGEVRHHHSFNKRPPDPKILEPTRKAPTKPTKAAAPAFDYFGSRYAALFADLTRDLGTAADLEAIGWAEGHGWPGITRTLRAADQRCEQLAARDDELAFRHAVEQLVGLFQAIRAAHSAAMAPDEPEPAPAITPTWRLTVTSTKLCSPPIRLDAARSVTGDVAHHVEILLGKLAIAVEHMNAGRTTAYSDLIDEWLAELALCGVVAVLEQLQ